MVDVRYERCIPPLLSLRYLEQIFSSLYEDARHGVYFCFRRFAPSQLYLYRADSTTLAASVSVDEPSLASQHGKRL